MPARLAVASTALCVIAGLASPARATPATNVDAVAHALSGRGHSLHRGRHGEVDVNICSDAVPAGYAHCDARLRTDLLGTDVAPVGAGSAGAGSANANVVPLDNTGYTPAYLQSAYNAPSATNGAGQTVAIVDAYDDPTVETDLATYRAQFGLPACTTANGCFRKVDENGGTTYPSADPSWANEVSLDVDMVSALCPNCHILVVEANSAFTTDLGTAVNEAVTLGANVVSNSYGGSEFPGETSFDTYYHHPGIAIVASAGDDGFGVEYPAASPDVVAVGGTSLNQATATGTRNATETVWSGTGSGCSRYEPKPTWQTDTGCTQRMVTDVSAVADPSTGVWVYDSADTGGWVVYGGTSAASPIIGAMYALAGNGTSTDPMNSYPYTHPGALNDVVTGSNGTCATPYFCNAGPGYDGPTGLGTPNTAEAFSGALPGAFSVVAAPLPAPLRPGTSETTTVTLTPLGGHNATVTVSASSKPRTGLTTTIAPSTVALGSAPAGSTLTLTAHRAGTYTVTISATDGKTTHTNTLKVAVNDFSMRVVATHATVVRGEPVRYTVRFAGAGSFRATVRLSVAGLGPRDRIAYGHRRSARISLWTPSATVAGSLTVIIRTSTKDPPGTLSLHFVGVSGTLRHDVTVILTLQ
jgi:subtilase family serine protease